MQALSSRLSVAPGLAQRRGSQGASARGSFVVRAAAPIPVPAQFSKAQPVGERIVVKVAPLETKTTGGILLPTEAQRRPTSGDVVGIGAGCKALKVGDTVVYSKWGIGVTDLAMQGDEYAVLRELDVIGTFPSSGATAADVSKLTPLFDRVLVRVAEAAATSKGGVLLPESAKEKPVVGEVVRTGPGKEDEEMKLKAGDKVVYFKYAGDKMQDTNGVDYVVLHQSDILGKL